MVTRSAANGYAIRGKRSPGMLLEDQLQLLARLTSSSTLPNSGPAGELLGKVGEILEVTRHSVP